MPFTGVPPHRRWIASRSEYRTALLPLLDALGSHEDHGPRLDEGFLTLPAALWIPRVRHPYLIRSGGVRTESFELQPRDNQNRIRATGKRDFAIHKSGGYHSSAPPADCNLKNLCICQAHSAFPSSKSKPAVVSGTIRNLSHTARWSTS
jgi:hypothetical protein